MVQKRKIKQEDNRKQ